MMTAEQALEIIRQIGGIFAESKFDEEHNMCWARPITDLPCSLGKAKYAFFKYSEYLASNNMILSKTDPNGMPITETMITIYGMLCNEFRENAEEINNALYNYVNNIESYTEDENKEISNSLAIKYGINPNSLTPETYDAEIELNNFLADMQSNYHPNEMLESDHPFLAYDGVVVQKKYHAVSRLAWDRYTKEDMSKR